MLQLYELDTNAVHPLASTLPLPLTLLDEEHFRSKVRRAAARHVRTRKGIGLLRVTVRDVGEEALREALQLECTNCEAVCRRGDGTYAILLTPCSGEELNELAHRIADRATLLAQEKRLGQVQTVTGGGLGGPEEVDPDALLAVAEKAFRTVLCHALSMAGSRVGTA